MKVIVYKDEELKSNREETILNTLIRTNQNPTYQCKEGYCGACRMKVKGNFDYIRIPIAYVQDDEVITCCAIPKENIEIF